MNHLEIYTFLTYYRQRLQIPNNVSALYLQEKIGLKVTEEDIMGFLISRTPTTKQQVQGLVNAGLKQAEIVEFTNLAQSNVSYHMHHPPKGTYKNPYWMHHVEKVPTIISNNANTK